MSCTTCPIYRPTLQEFANFSKYIQHIERSVNLELVGLVKIIPPKGWYDKICNLQELSNLLIQRPVAQLVSRVGTGTYTVNLLEKPDLTVEEFHKFAETNCLNKTDISYEDIERKFWRSIGLNGGLDDPLYGADMVGSLFGSDHASSWNVNHLDTPLKIIGHNLPGVSNSMLYFGCWRAMFAFHTEDMELYSINYLHYGAPKSWYSVPPKYKKRFEVMAQSYYPEESYHCSEFLRHKTSLISPNRLKDCAIPYNTAVQEIGEFMITFPGSYHQGFNHGFNIAEATNFATERWIDVARTARVCRCQPDSVKIDMDIFETIYYRDKMKNKLRLQQSLLSQSQTQSRPQTQPQTKEQQDNQSDLVDLTHWEETNSSSLGTSLNSDNFLNTNNDDETQWLLRCKCGKRVWYPLIPTPNDSDPAAKDEIHNLNFAYLIVAEGDIFQCVDCGLWCHIICIYGPECNEFNISDNAKCHMCSNFTISPVEQENGSGDSTTRTEYQISVTISSQRTTDSNSQDDEHGQSSQESINNNHIKKNKKNSECEEEQDQNQDQEEDDHNRNKDNKDSRTRGADKRKTSSTTSSKTGAKSNSRSPRVKSKKFKPQLHDNITAAVYSKSLLRYENITGDIVAVEGSNIRIHVKGTKRSDDPWINTAEYEFTNDLILNFRSSPSESQKQKNKQKKTGKSKFNLSQPSKLQTSDGDEESNGNGTSKEDHIQEDDDEGDEIKQNKRQKVEHIPEEEKQEEKEIQETIVAEQEEIKEEGNEDNAVLGHQIALKHFLLKDMGLEETFQEKKEHDSLIVNTGPSSSRSGSDTTTANSGSTSSSLPPPHPSNAEMKRSDTKTDKKKKKKKSEVQKLEIVPPSVPEAEEEEEEEVWETLPPEYDVIELSD